MRISDWSSDVCSSDRHRTPPRCAARPRTPRLRRPRQGGGSPVPVTIPTIAELRFTLDTHRAAGRSVGFVPTMGYLHAGHASLMDAARSSTDVAVTSIFLNPLQLAPTDDLAASPRDLERPTALAAEHGIHLPLVPTSHRLHPRPP